MVPIPPATPRQLQLIAVLCKERGQDYEETCRLILDGASQVRNVAEAETMIAWLKVHDVVCVVDSSDIPPEFHTRKDA